MQEAPDLELVSRESNVSEQQEVPRSSRLLEVINSMAKPFALSGREYFNVLYDISLQIGRLAVALALYGVVSAINVEKPISQLEKAWI